MSVTELTVGAAQFAVGTDVDANLATCIRMIESVAAEGAGLIVLPEFINHLSVYESAEHCRAVAVTVDGPFVSLLAECAADHAAFVVGACTVRRPDAVTVTSLLLGPDGALVGQADKQTLMGNERQFLSPGTNVAPALPGPEALGIYACMDGVTPETPAALRVGGARVLCNSLNSFAKDEASLHIPVRAAENGVWVVAANKVGPLLPPDRIDAFSEAMGLPTTAFDGAGESQIVAPDGEALARAPETGEAVVVATIEVPRRDAGLVGGGPHPVFDRRSELFGRLSGPADAAAPAADAVAVAIVVDPAPDTIERAMAEATLVVLPELVAVPAAIPADTWVVTSRRDGPRHVGELHSVDGLIATQPQLLRSERPGAPGPNAPDGEVTELGDELVTIDLPIGRLAMLVGDDVRLPEPARLAAVRGVNLLVVPSHVDVAWVDRLALVERAAENRVCLAAASRRTPVGGGLLVDLPTDFTLWAPNRDRPFDGTINRPDVTRPGVADDHVVAELHPSRSSNRFISKDTDLVGGRAMESTAVLLAGPPPTAAVGSPDV